MKVFSRIFIPLVAMIAGIQVLGALVFRWLEGTAIQYPLPFIFMMLSLEIPMFHLTKVAGKVVEKNGALLPLIPCSLFSIYVMVESPRPVWCLLFLVEMVLLALAVIWAFQMQKKDEEKKAREYAEFKERAYRRLNELKTAYFKQFIVITDVKVKDIVYEMDDECLLFQLPDNRFLVISEKTWKQRDFEYLLDSFRNEADHDSDVLGYMDNAAKSECKMIVSDACGTHQVLGRGDPSFIEFDYSLLEDARPILSDTEQTPSVSGH